MLGDVLVERPLLVSEVSKVRVLARDVVLAPVPATHAGVQSLPAAQALHLYVSSIAVNPVATLRLEISVVLEKYFF